MDSGLWTVDFFTEDKIVTAEERGAAEFLAEGIDDHGEALLGIVLAGGDIQTEAGPKRAVINVGEFERDKAETDAPFPGFAEQGRNFGVGFSFEVSGFFETFAGLLFIHVVVTDFDGQRAD